MSGGPACEMICPAGREAAFSQLHEFLPRARLYGRDRNNVVPGHAAVTRLSPALRHRLLSEDEAAAAVLAAHPFNRVEKLIQEIYWRRYWKAWLSLRPQVWTDYLAEISSHSLISAEAQLLLERVISGQSGNAVIDHFTHELLDTGYLHNHARMWYAAWWIHEARLPWALGAAFFYQHLLDGDPASNTLSWRWVAGLQTPGKTYLARRSNLEKYLAPELLESLASGLPAFENPRAYLPNLPAKPTITCPELASSPLADDLLTGLWIHEEDLSPETSPLASQTFPQTLVTGHTEAWEALGFPEAKQSWLRAALADAANRAEKHWGNVTQASFPNDIPTALVTWAASHGLRQVATLRPDIGPLHDALPSIQTALQQAGIQLHLADRPLDLQLRPLATAGFFSFWEKMRPLMDLG
jgi:deoxyribodipyrimidine photo-lyase